MYSEVEFIRDISTIQKYFQEEDRIIKENGIEALPQSFIVDNYVRLIAEQFTEEEDIAAVQEDIWWFITDNAFGEANLEIPDYGRVPDIKSLYNLLIQ